MKWKFLAVVVVVVGCERSAEPVETVSVVVARRSIPTWVTIDKPEKFFRAAQYPKGEEPKGGIADLQMLKRKVVMLALAEDQPVKASDLSPLAVPEGLRAVAIPQHIECLRAALSFQAIGSMWSRKESLKTMRKSQRS